MILGKFNASPKYESVSRSRRILMSGNIIAEIFERKGLMSGGILCSRFLTWRDIFPATHRTKKLFWQRFFTCSVSTSSREKRFSVHENSLLFVVAMIVNKFPTTFLYVSLGRCAYPHTPQVAKPKNWKFFWSSLLRGLPFVIQRLLNLVEKFLLKSLAYAIRHAPRHDIENVRSKRIGSKHARSRQGQVASVLPTKPTENICAEYQWAVNCPVTKALNTLYFTKGFLSSSIVRSRGSLN